MGHNSTGHEPASSPLMLSTARATEDRPDRSQATGGHKCNCILTLSDSTIPKSKVTVGDRPGVAFWPRVAGFPEKTFTCVLDGP
jgi:hypothetical protein